MRKRKTFGTESNDEWKPEDELQIISFNNDLQEKFSPEKKMNNPWDIEPWQNQQENPSESPERRKF